MKIHFDQLIANLKQTLSLLYLIAGEEILLMQEAENAICAAATAANFNEHIKFTVDAGFDWTLFQQTIQNNSLFSDKQCISLDLTSGKLTETGKKILTDFLQHPYPDKLLIIRTGKLDAALQKTAWYKLAEKVGVVVPVWPLAPAQLPAWIQRRLKAVDLQADPEGLQLLVMRTEGNLLATAQEIEKLSLLYTKGLLTVKEIQEASSNNARFSVFNLIDAILQENFLDTLRILKTLKEEATEAVLILWVLRREMHQWVQWSKALQQGKNLSQIIAGNFVMEKRRHLIERLLKRCSLENIYDRLQHAAKIDQMIKGAINGNTWNELSTLSLALAGIETLKV